jgi:hypothetical protein
MYIIIKYRSIFTVYKIKSSRAIFFISRLPGVSRCILKHILVRQVQQLRNSLFLHPYMNKLLRFINFIVLEQHSYIYCSLLLNKKQNVKQQEVDTVKTSRAQIHFIFSPLGAVIDESKNLYFVRIYRFSSGVSFILGTSFAWMCILCRYKILYRITHQTRISYIFSLFLD